MAKREKMVEPMRWVDIEAGLSKEQLATLDNLGYQLGKTRGEAMSWLLSQMIDRMKTMTLDELDRFLAEAP